MPSKLNQQISFCSATSNNMTTTPSPHPSLPILYNEQYATLPLKKDWQQTPSFWNVVLATIKNMKNPCQLQLNLKRQNA
jgi:hypothetical protein